MSFNKLIINIFSKLINQLEDEFKTDINAKNNIFKINIFKNFIKIFKDVDIEINSLKDLKELQDIKGVGKGIITRITEIIKTNTLKELNSDYDNEQVYDTFELEKIIGIGPKNAKKLVETYDIKTIDELKKAIKSGIINEDSKLNLKLMKLGLKYYKYLDIKIPRKEIETINLYLNKMIKKINSNLILTICGSFRRCKTESSDIDVLITHPDTNSLSEIEEAESNYLSDFVDKLIEEKFIIDSITPDNYTTKYMGLCKYKNSIPRRIDIRFVPFKSYSASLLYFTGSKDFNKKMRSIAKKKNMKLNEYGLYKLTKSNIYKRVKDISTEKDIFDKLDMEYVEPDSR